MPRVHASVHVAALPASVFDESVYALIPAPLQAAATHCRYTSGFASQTRKEWHATLGGVGSMGPSKVKLALPTQFLKRKPISGPPLVARATDSTKERGTLDHGIKNKGTLDHGIKNKGTLDYGIKNKSTLDHTFKNNPKEEKGAVKDHVKQNALDIIHSTPRRSNSKIPVYVNKRFYGQNPDYNVARQAEQKLAVEASIATHDRNERMKVVDALARRGIKVLDEEERIRILAGLKTNWKKLNNDYQRLSLTVDTVPKIARKVGLERDLKEYEELIARFETSNIHVNCA